MADATKSTSDRIRGFLLEHAEEPGLAALAAARFGISRQAVNRHLRALTREGAIHAQGNTQDRRYRLIRRELLSGSYDLTPELQEDRVWSRDVRPLLQTLPKSVVEVWNFCFTEIFNNALDHSEGTEVSVHLEMDAIGAELAIQDDGVGIFYKIQKAMGLDDVSETVLELVKGKFTTDKARHSGLGVFFSSRMLDRFDISSGLVHYSYEGGDMRFWLLPEDEATAGTTVLMKLSNSSTRTTSATFEEFGDGRPLNFNKTIIPLGLASSGNDPLVSRSQAKRVLARVDQFEHVVLDFSGVDTVGQGFADEIFRVFANAHPKLKLTPTRMTRQVREMIQAVQKEALRQAKADRKNVPISDR